MVDENVWVDRIDHFLGVRNISPQTKSQYRDRLVAFMRWCSALGISPEVLATPDISRYLDHLRSVPYSRSTVEGHLVTIRLFYRFAASHGMVRIDPMLQVQSDVILPEARDTLTVDQLRAMWDTADSHRKKVVVGLLGICALRPVELCDAQIRDLSMIDGHHVLRIPTRTNKFEYAYAALPDEVFAQIALLIGERGNGYIVTRRDEGKFDRRTLLRIVEVAGKKAEIPFRVIPLTLSFSLRAIAIERGFSYVSVARTVAAIDPRRLSRWLSLAPESIRTHSAYRLARLVLGSKHDTESHLSHAEVMAREGDSHPAAALGYAGAALERHLRLLSSEHGIHVNKSDPTLASYSALLRAAKIIQPVDVQRIAQVQTLRNDAAHGWFERISVTEVETVIRIGREISLRYPVSAPTAPVSVRGHLPRS